MRVPLSWLGEYVDIAPGTTPEDVLEALVRVAQQRRRGAGDDLVRVMIEGDHDWARRLPPVVR